MPRLHLTLGLLSLAGFIASGIYLRLNITELAAHNDSIRWMFRSNHIYILMSGLINLALSRDTAATTGRRSRIRALGSILALVAPLLLAAAFLREPAAANPDRPFTRLGIITLAAGTILRVASSPGRPPIS